MPDETTQNQILEGENIIPLIEPRSVYEDHPPSRLDVESSQSAGTANGLVMIL